MPQNREQLEQDIRALRGNRSQQDTERLVAERFPEVSGVVTTALSHWEKGRRQPLPRQLLALIDLSPRPVEDEHILRILTNLSQGAGQSATDYLSLTNSWPAGLTPKQKVASFRSWAATHAARPRRGHPAL